MHVMGHHNIYDVGLLMKSHRHMLVYVKQGVLNVVFLDISIMSNI